MGCLAPWCQQVGRTCLPVPPVLLHNLPALFCAVLQCVVAAQSDTPVAHNQGAVHSVAHCVRDVRYGRLRQRLCELDTLCGKPHWCHQAQDATSIVHMLV